MLMAPANNRFGGRCTHFASDAKPYCRCWHKKKMRVVVPTPWEQLNECSCGEEDDIKEWKWQNPAESESSWVVLSDNNQLVTFHPVYSSGTAAVKGDTPMNLNWHYYWEVKMLTDTYGTDIMVGVGTDKIDITESRHKFSSLLGSSTESYGLSYTGKVQHDSKMFKHDILGFCKGTIVGIRLDMWQGTLEFYINRKSQGISFYNLRRHSVLYPMVSSTAAQSSLKIVYAASWKASLMVDALKILSSSVSAGAKTKLPPGLWYRLKTQFWLTMPSKGCICDDEESDSNVMEPDKSTPDVPAEIVPFQYPRFYVNSVERNYRLVLWEEQRRRDLT